MSSCYLSSSRHRADLGPELGTPMPDNLPGQVVDAVQGAAGRR